MNKLITLFVTVLLASCGMGLGPDDENDVTSKFKGTWNIYESLVVNPDNTITYYALPWGGLVDSFKERNIPVDWSGYESIRFEFAEPTKVPTQIMVTDKVKTWGKAGITSLTCYFDGYDLKSVEEVALQASDTTVITVKQVYLTPGRYTWKTTPIWAGECAFGNWVNGFTIEKEYFETASEGDKLEFVFTTENNNPDITFWLLKTIYSNTDNTLEGNNSELNNWGCATMGRHANVYRIVLTSKDVEQLREHGLFVNGYYCTVTKVNLLTAQIGGETENSSY